MKKHLLFLSLMLTIGLTLKSQESQWFTPFSGSTKISQHVAIDKDGNSYVLGSFEGGATIGTEEVSSASATSFVVKIDPTGERIVWMTQLQTDGNSVGRKIAVDNSGNVAITGDFRGEVGVSGKTVKTSGNDRDWYVAYISSNGQLQWIKSGGGDNEVFEIGIGVGFDGQGNVYALGNVCGHEGGKVDNAVFFAQTRTSNETGKASFDGKSLESILATSYSSLIVKVSANGDVIWTNTDIEGASGGMDVDDEGNVYVGTGYSNYTKIFGETYSSSGSSTAMILKMDTDGSLLWQKAFGPEGEGKPGKAPKNPIVGMSQGIKVSGSGHVVVLGSATGSVYDRSGEQLSGKIKSAITWHMGMDPSGNVKWFGEMEFGLSSGGFDVDEAGNSYLSVWGLGKSFMGKKLKGPALVNVNNNGNIDWVYEGKVVDKKKKYQLIGYSSVALNPSDNSVVLAGLAQFQDISTWKGMNKSVTTTKTYNYLTLNLIK